MDHEHHAHLHLMLSANEVGSKRRHRLSREAFRDLQADLERYLLSHYPQLGDRALRSGKSKTYQLSDAEFQLAKRTGQPGKRQALQNQLNAAIAASTSAEDLAHKLRTAGIELHVRGKNITAKTAEGFKARLGKLGLVDYQDALRPVAMRMQLVQERVSALQQAREMGSSLDFGMEMDAPEMKMKELMDSEPQLVDPLGAERPAIPDWKFPDFSALDLPANRPLPARWVLVYEEEALTLIDTVSGVVIGYLEGGAISADSMISLLTGTLERLGKPVSFKVYGLPGAWVLELEHWQTENGIPKIDVSLKSNIPLRFRQMRKNQL